MCNSLNANLLNNYTLCTEKNTVLIGAEALMSYDWRRYCVVRIGPYSLNNLRLG